MQQIKMTLFVGTLLTQLIKLTFQTLNNYFPQSDNDVRVFEQSYDIPLLNLKQ